MCLFVYLCFWYTSFIKSSKSQQQNLIFNTILFLSIFLDSCDYLPIVPAELQTDMSEGRVVLTNLPIVCTSNKTYGSICADGLNGANASAICLTIGNFYGLYSLIGKRLRNWMDCFCDKISIQIFKNHKL